MKLEHRVITITYILICASLVTGNQYLLLIPVHVHERTSISEFLKLYKPYTHTYMHKASLVITLV